MEEEETGTIMATKRSLNRKKISQSPIELATVDLFNSDGDIK